MNFIRIAPFNPLNSLYVLLTSHYKATLRLGVPIAVGQVGVIVMGFADTMMVGRYATDALAAASFVNSLFNLVNFLFLGYSYGLTPIVSACYGRGDLREAGGALKLSLTANACFVLLMAAVLGAVYPFLHCFGQPPELLPLIRPYFLVVMLSMLFVVPFNVLRQFTDGTTATSTAMWILLFANALNIAGNALLIYGIGPFPELGLLGAGLSTLFSRMVAAGLLAGVVMWKKRYAPYRKGFAQGKISTAELRRMNAASMPVALQMGMETFAFTMSGIMAGWISAVALAGYQVMVTIGALGFMFYYAFGAGTAIRVGTFTGVGDDVRVKEAARAGLHILLTLAGIVSVAFLIWGEALIGFFTKDAAVLAVAVGLIPFLMLYQLGDAMQICFANALRGTGRVTSMMYIAFVSYIVINIPAGYLIAFPLDFGINGLFFSFSIGLFVAAALFAREFYKQNRRAAG